MMSISLGMDTNKGNRVLDLTTAPHCLIAGQTGSGKSVFLNSILTGLIASKSPEELRFIMIDPKVVELTPYNAAPHMLCPVITDVEPAVKALDWAVEEMNTRFRLLASYGVRNVQGYNNIPGVEKLPLIVVVIDEFADLMYMGGDKVEIQIIRIAQKARAVGIHLILATQRPSVDVITGILKANIPTRICFKVAGQIDSRIVMDVAGAELLKGRGDMLVKTNESPEPVRLQGYYLNDADIDSVISIAADKYRDNYSRIDLEDKGEDNELSSLLNEVIAKAETRRMNRRALFGIRRYH